MLSYDLVQHYSTTL